MGQSFPACDLCGTSSLLANGEWWEYYGQVLVGLYKAQALASSGQRAEALQALDANVERVTGLEEGTPRAAHLRLHFGLLRTLCQLACGETGSLQQTTGEHATLDHRRRLHIVHQPIMSHFGGNCPQASKGVAPVFCGKHTCQKAICKV